jgi:hypothetical protein
MLRPKRLLQGLRAQGWQAFVLQEQVEGRRVLQELRGPQVQESLCIGQVPKGSL